MNSEAWFLHKHPSGDTSARLSLFTREKGIVTCFYKGARSPKKQVFLQPFIPLWLSLDQKKDWYYARNLESIAAPLIFKNTTLFAALYMNELVYYALKPFDPHPKLYDTYQFTLNALAALTDRLVMESLLRQFEWTLLRECGYSLSIMSNSESTPPPYYQFIAGKGFIWAKEGWCAQHIHAIVSGQFNDVQVLKTAKLIMRQAIDHLLGGRELKSRHLFIKPGM